MRHFTFYYESKWKFLKVGRIEGRELKDGKTQLVILGNKSFFFPNIPYKSYSISFQTHLSWCNG